LNIVFAGTPVFAQVALQRLHGAGHRVPLALTQPDRPAGRGLRLQASPVKTFALEHGIEVAQPRGLRLDGRYADDAAVVRDRLAVLAPDAVVVAAYGLILPPWLLDLPRLGCVNIHASLLPRWRGAAPVQRAIEAGDARTGITIMQMDAGLDTGPMVATVETPIHPTDTAGSLTDRLAGLGAAAIVEALGRLEAAGSLAATPQPAQGATYAGKIDSAQALLDWTLPAPTLARKVRAFDPAPGARFMLDGAPVKVWAAEAGSLAGEPGTVTAVDRDALEIACGEGSLRLLTVQPAGGKRMPGAAFALGRRLAAGDRV
jgi:methionyl-tRNA formyltransferase